MASKTGGVKERERVSVWGTLIAVAVILLAVEAAMWGAPQDAKDLSQQIFDVMVQMHGVKAGYRPVHAKGIVCQGTYHPSAEARTLSRGSHFRGPTVPVTVRFSDGAADPGIADGSPDAGPRGIGIEFKLQGGKPTDIVAISHNGFIVSTGEEFLALQKAIAATDPSKPHPWPIEAFLGSHPRALKFVQEAGTVPESFATETFYANNAFLFVNAAGMKQAGRYFIVPAAGQHDLNDSAAKAKPANFLSEELKARLAKGSVKFQLLVQLANPGDQTSDSSLVWPDNRKKVDLGTITITSAVANSEEVEKDLLFDPAQLTDGIELSDDPLPELRSKVYMLSFMNRTE